jgi:hypothetical protein
MKGQAYYHEMIDRELFTMGPLDNVKFWERSRKRVLRLLEQATKDAREEERRAIIEAAKSRPR